MISARSILFYSLIRFRELRTIFRACHLMAVKTGAKVPRR